jgi:hypothetical protein
MNTTFPQLLPHIRIKRGLVFGMLIIIALLAFEVFNYSTTDFALNDLLGDLRFAGIPWATILAIAFCGIDFAGIARLFTPEQGADEPAEVWYLFGAWLLAASMNAALTWWGVSIAILNHQTLGNAVVGRETLIRVVPVFVAIMVWLIRILIIGTFSVAGERMFSQSDRRSRPTTARSMPSGRSPSSILPSSTLTQPGAAPTFRPAAKPVQHTDPTYSRSEPTYHPISISAGGNQQMNIRPNQIHR